MQQPQGHLPSEENVLDDVEDEDEGEEQYIVQNPRQHQYPVFSQHSSQAEFTPYKGNNL